MRTRTWKNLLILCLLLLGMHEADSNACARAGFCDLSQVNWDQQEVQALAGEWQFYWNQLITPAELAQGKGQRTGYFSPESNWAKAPFPEVAAQSQGYATYHLEFKARSDQALTLRVPEMASAVRVWFNGKELDPIGKVGTDANTEVARKSLTFYDLLPGPELNTITIQISNFSRLSIGAKGGLMLGPNRTIYREYQLDLVRDLITVGAIFIMAFYHFYLWGIRKSRYAPLYFGLYCLAVSIRTLTAGEGEILTLVFPDTPLELQFKTEYAGMTVGFFALTVLTSELYPKEFSKYISYMVAVICALWLVMILATPATIYPLFLRFMQMVIAIVGTTQFVSLGLACARKREGARIFMAGFSMFFLAGLFDILAANNVIQMMPLAHLGTFCIVFSQAIILSKRFDQAFDRVEHTERELRQLNEVLEHKVEERTDQINTILNNVSSGFLLIDRQGRILPGFTESCHGLLGAKLQAGQILPELIQLGDAVRRSFRVAVAQVFEDNMPTEVSLSQIPTRVKLGAKTLGLSCVALRNHEQKIHAVLFTIHDATDLQEAEYQVHINTMLLNIIQEKESFKFFLHDYREELKAILLETEKDNQPALRTFLHTLKGNLAAFAIHDLVGHIHQIESLPRVEKSNIMAIADHFERLLHDHEKVLRLGTFDSQIVEVNRDDFLAVESYARHRIKEPDRQNIINLCHKSRLMTIHSYIGPLENGAVNLAQRLGKNIRCEIEGQSLRVDEQYSPVLRNLVHIIRNAVDHGIELPEDRGDKGPEGVIRLQFAFDSAAFCIAVEDDGAGLNLEKIREKAQKLGVASAHDRMSDEDLTRYILLQGFSTADSTSLISGRGVGMAAVHEAVQKLQGTLSIKNQVGHGVRFEIKLPLLGTHALGVQDSLRTLQIV